jgi:hypothetical protein
MACAAYTPGDIKPAGDLCNTCSCNANGAWSCTKNACPACTPGAQSADGTVRCMNCTCNQAGAWVCQTLRC